MKKYICLLMAVLFVFTLTACSGNTNDAAGTSAPAAAENAETPENNSSSAAAADDNDGSDPDANTAGSGKIDIDLTSMSSTMVYSEVLNMMQSPVSYLGKTVRIKGAFSVVEENGNRYYACIIRDAAACCAQGMEFTWAGDHKYPDDYPEPDTEITVTGTFNTYTEGSSSYVQLKDADVQF